MKLHLTPLLKGHLPLSLCTAFISIEAAQARDIPAGQAFTVFANTPLDDYRLLGQGARLFVSEGGSTGAISTLSGSSVRIERGNVTTDQGRAIDLIDSVATINNSIVTALANPAQPGTDRAALATNRTVVGSEATVTNSVLSGIGRGVNAAGDSTVVLDNTSVMGYSGGAQAGPIRGDLGIGMVVGGSDVAVRNGSSITGDHDGIVMISAQVLPGYVAHSRVNIDASSVTGKEGSALVVTGRPNVSDPMAQITVSNGSTLTGGNGIILQVQQEASAHLNVNDSRLVGDIFVSDDSFAEVELNNHASLTGKITNLGVLDIDGSSQWVMEGDSTVGKLGLNGGTVDLRGTSNDFHTLTVGELSGAGVFALGTDLAAQTSDRLDITGSASGSHQLLVQNSGIDPLVGSDPVQLVHTGSGDAQFSLIGGQVDFGTFAYQLESTENATGGSDWSLVQTGELSNSSRSVVGLFSAAPTVWYGESATLRSRMGELRNGNDQGGGWIRSYGNKQNMSAGGGVAYKQVQQGISFGADMPVSNSDGQWLVGLMGGYSKSDLDLKQGTKGSVDSYYLGAYSTWLADDGFYVDALIKANRFQNESQVRMADGQKAKGSYNNAGVGASVEVGQHIKLEDQWFVEPFAQASGLVVGGENYHLDNGLRANSNGADSLLGKAGSHLGRTFALDDGGFVQPYVKAAVAHEFVSGNKVKINDNRFSNDLSGSRVELGAGVAAQMTDVLQVHADFDFMKGSNIEQPWGVNVGVRYNW
jgi:outer membrane autotransporter protein